MMLIRLFLGDPGEVMRKRYIVLIVMSVLLVVFAGCTRNPAAAKRKYVESGIKYMDQKKYDSAVIQFKKALQIDPRYGEAHYELGQAELAQQHWAAVFREFSEAIIMIPTTSRHIWHWLPCGGRLENTPRRKKTPV